MAGAKTDTQKSVSGPITTQLQGEGDTVDLSNTSVSCADVALLEAKGVTVTHTCL